MSYRADKVKFTDRRKQRQYPFSLKGRRVNMNKKSIELTPSSRWKIITWTDADLSIIRPIAINLNKFRINIWNFILTICFSKLRLYYKFICHFVHVFSNLKLEFVSIIFQAWLLIGCQHSRQSMRSHNRKPLLANRKFNMNFAIPSVPSGFTLTVTPFQRVLVYIHTLSSSYA